MEQDITEHKVKKSKEVIAANARKQAEARRTNSPSPRRSKVPLQTYSKLTKRKVGRILSAVHSAIVRLVKKETGLSELEIREALSSVGVAKVVNRHLHSENIELVDR